MLEVYLSDMFLFVRPISLCSSVFPHFENLEFVCKAPEIRNHLEEEAGLWGFGPQTPGSPHTFHRVFPCLKVPLAYAENLRKSTSALPG